MKNARLSLIALAITTASAGMAWAADAAAPKTRELVRAELVDAQRNGTLIADGQTGATFRDLNPSRYMQPATVSTVTRAQVQAEFKDAWARGELIADGETGRRAKDMFPGSYTAEPMPAPMASTTTDGKTRDEVRAELDAAQRNGELVADGQTGATFRDLAPHRYATQTMAMQPRMSESTQVGQVLQGDHMLQLR
jgi:hypothetical protein